MGKRKLVHLSEEGEEAEAGSNEDAGDEEQAREVKPIGEVIKKTGRGKGERRYYQAFELDSGRYNLEDSVLITPEEKSQKPYVAIIKEIKQSRDGSLAITGQWFYRPEEAERKGGGSWEADDARELFYSFHRDEVPAESVMHKCVVHFIPSHKKSPTRSKHPGFIVRKVYDTVEKKLWNLTDKDYEDTKQKEIDLLVQKTKQTLGEFMDVDPEEVVTEVESVEKRPTGRKTLRKKFTLQPPPLTIKEDSDDTMLPSARAETPTPIDGHGGALRQGGHLTKNKARDRWLEKLLQSLDFMRKAPSEEQTSDAPNISEKEKELFTMEEIIETICALERAAFENIGDIHKYNLKMRSLDYNLKQHHILTRRLMKKELDPMTVVTMSPAELKDGMTAAERSAQEPEQPKTIQIASVRCGVCNEPQVGVKDIINAPHGDRYLLECPKCGNSWYSARDSISSLTIETVNPSPTPVGPAPLATGKFEEAQKEIAATRGKEKEEAAATREKEKEEAASSREAPPSEEAPAEEAQVEREKDTKQEAAEAQGEQPTEADKIASEEAAPEPVIDVVGE